MDELRTTALLYYVQPVKDTETGDRLRLQRIGVTTHQGQLSLLPSAG